MPEIIFKNKVVVKSLPELVLLCDEFWDEARDYLYLPRQPFTTFLLELSQQTKDDKYRDLAKEARRIVKENSDRDIGLEKFLQATGLVDEPIADVDPELVFEGSLSKTRASLKITNRGRGYLYGSLKADSKLDLERKEFGVSSRNAIEVEVGLSATGSRASTTSLGEITIHSNATKRQPQIKVKVSFEGSGPTQVDRLTDTRLTMLSERMEHYFSEKDLNAALSYSEQILELDHQHPNAIHLNLQVRSLQKNIEDLLRKGSVALDANQLGEALEAFHEVREIEPTNRVAIQGIQQVHERQKQGALGCVALFIGLAAGIGVVLWIRHRTESTWLIVYSGYLALAFGTFLINGLFLQENKFQGALNALLLPVGQLLVLCGTYVMWQRWSLSVILAIFVGHFISRQLQATFCWELYGEQRGGFRKAWRNFERQMSRA